MASGGLAMSRRHAGRAGGELAVLHAQQHRDVVTHAAQALLAAGQHLAHQAVMHVVLTGPLADSDALKFQPGAGLSCSAKFLHRMVRIGVITEEFMTEEQANEIATRLTEAMLAAPTKLLVVQHSKPGPSDIGQALAAHWRATRDALLACPPPTPHS